MISSHADYRHEDYFFARTQSRAMLALDWETRAPALKTWDNYVAVVVAVVLLGLAALVYP